MFFTRAMVILLLFATANVFAQVGTGSAVPFRRENSVLLLDAAQTAAACGFEFKEEVKGRLVTLCDDGDAGICIPIRLTETSFQRQGTTVFIAADVLAKALQLQIGDNGDEVRVVRHSRAAKASVQAYNAGWPKGRGFRVGQTLPDIPLVDTDGREVRFSQFLGKQYILYCWASW